ncbi:hypothetical protein EsHS_00007450, partial [Epichloe bromicola]
GLPNTPTFDATTTASELAAHYAAQIKGKVVLTIGVSPRGLGATFVLAIAKAQPSLLILAARNPSKAEQTARDIETASPGVKTQIVRAAQRLARLGPRCGNHCPLVGQRPRHRRPR